MELSVLLSTYIVCVCARTLCPYAQGMEECFVFHILFHYVMKQPGLKEFGNFEHINFFALFVEFQKILKLI